MADVVHVRSADSRPYYQAVCPGGGCGWKSPNRHPYGQKPPTRRGLEQDGMGTSGVWWDPTDPEQRKALDDAQAEADSHDATVHGGVHT